MTLRRTPPHRATCKDLPCEICEKITQEALSSAPTIDDLRKMVWK